MSQVLYPIEEVKNKIAQGHHLLLAGDEAALRQLPPGHWIGGTIPYFMAEEGGLSTRDRIFVTELPDFVKAATIKVYNEATIPNVYQEIPENGFGVIIIPATSHTHLAFALKAPLYQDFATRPLTGWISGVHLSDLGNISPKVFDGEHGLALEDQAVVMLVQLPPNKIADISILNIFQQGEGDTITFGYDGFSVSEAMVNGKKYNLADYVIEKGLDTKLPLVADYYGVPVNISFQNVDTAKREVTFYAPVFEGARYRHAGPVANYVSEFKNRMPANGTDIFFSCNCILNYLYSELEGKQTGGITGPITFGEVAYQLLNQTMVYLTISDLPAGE